MRRIPVIAALTMLLVTGPAMALPPPYTAFYEAFAYGNTLKTHSTVNYEPGRIRMSLDARVVGFLRLLGRFEMSRESIVSNGPEGLRLLESHHKQVQPRRNREVHTRFDWAARMARGTNNGEDFSVQIGHDTMDYLSTLLLIMHELRSDTGATREQVEVIERDRVRSYRLEHGGSERLDTKLGRLDTVKITRSDSDRGVSLSAWFAPDLHFIPVRFDYEADGRVYVLDITELDWH